LGCRKPWDAHNPLAGNVNVFLECVQLFDRYNIASERDLADAAKKLELSYRQAKVSETETETENVQPDRIQ